MWTRLKPNEQDELLIYLNQHAPATCAFLGNIKAAGIRYNPLMMRGGTYYTYQSHNGTMGGVIATYNDGNVILHIDDITARERVVELLSHMRFHSVWGMCGWLPSRMELYAATSIPMDERTLVTMERDRSVPLPSMPHTAIRIDQRMSLGRYMPFIKQCLYEGFGFKTNSTDLKKRMRERTAREAYWLLYNETTPVAQAHIQSMTLRHGVIGGICTLRDYRRQGFAREITAVACSFVEGAGRTSVLSVSAKNSAAIQMYEKLGFFPAGQTRVYMRERSFKGDENQ